MSLIDLPPELIEEISLNVVLFDIPGPPTSFCNLLLISPDIHSSLSVQRNPHLYVKIFGEIFDFHLIKSLIGDEHASSGSILWTEIARRFRIMKPMMTHTQTDFKTLMVIPGELEEILLCAYLMLLENEGNNLRVLRDYAYIDKWLECYWLDRYTTTFSSEMITHDRWPEKGRRESLAMWIFWFLLENGASARIDQRRLTMLKIYSLGAHKYCLTAPSWLHFNPPRGKENIQMTYVGQQVFFRHSPAGVPAILSYLSCTPGSAITYQSPTLSIPHFHTEWARSLEPGRGISAGLHCGAYIPGSISGVWEGVFTFIEFPIYAALLAGAPPSIVRDEHVVQHKQTWRLREYHLVGEDQLSTPGVLGPTNQIEPLDGGEPLHSYFPLGTRLRETSNYLEVRKSSNSTPVLYRNFTKEQESLPGSKPIIDSIIIGESHSAWGHSRLLGRVRPCDGFISMTKEYLEEDRGKWIYRGYLVGDSDAHIGGRWRDTISPAAMPGYEGCFAMRRRHSLVTL